MPAAVWAPALISGASSVGGALINSHAQGSAADKQAEGVKKGLKQSASLADQSRNAAIELYSQGRKSSQAGLGAALDFYKKSAPTKYAPMTLGNAAAQGIIGQGATQANNAILGNAVDMSFAQQINPDLSFINAAQLPVLPESPLYAGLGASQSTEQGAVKPSTKDLILTGGGIAMSPEEMLKPKNALTNPLGLSDKIASKDPVSKALKKLF